MVGQHEDTITRFSSGMTKASSGPADQSGSERQRKFAVDRWSGNSGPTYNDSAIRGTVGSKFRNDKMNETFTSQKAKRNVSDYYNVNNRPVHSREREERKVDTSTSDGFSTVGLENIGNTCYINVILQ